MMGLFICEIGNAPSKFLLREFLSSRCSCVAQGGISLRSTFVLRNPGVKAFGILGVNEIYYLSVNETIWTTY